MLGLGLGLGLWLNILMSNYALRSGSMKTIRLSQLCHFTNTMSILPSQTNKIWCPTAPSPLRRSSMVSPSMCPHLKKIRSQLASSMQTHSPAHPCQYGGHGHLGIIMAPMEYASISNTTWASPYEPGPIPSIAHGPDPVAAAQLA
jgi:hypothetical protein